MLAQTWYVLSTTEVGRHVEMASLEATKEITEMAFCYYYYSVDES